ncbi:oxygen-independent coproporphyrinogen-3 oxidase [Anaerobacterium chartisolvens]|uniref:Heme chaperone HemW n=1 Tax=Anaerobacterium chartisolvens TaxID=1297424 RepID=A0A369AM96_9FIRM|nr:radical SAM protein [Anaerobacterium chartisolvens]RCX10512.1 oxygen-independent coproporphyrinogen-3 oxidase [Anaerobacterium chartisolvens]
MLLTSLLRIFLTRSLSPFVFRDKHQDKLNFTDLDNMGLYVHIPFCRSICGFCPYCKERYEEAKALRYKDALLKEIELVCGGMDSKKTVTSLYFGGGTPALMLESLGEIIDRLNCFFEIRDGIGVELHPDDISDTVLSTLKNIGVTMISLGVQSFNEGALEKIGRRQDGLREKLSLIAKYQFSVIDIDLIFGIPGQNKEILKSDIESAFGYGATQVSTYPFIDFTFADNKYSPLSGRHKREMLESLNDFCVESGAKRTSVWTFAKEGTDKYSSVTRDTFLGFGVSATTLLKDIFKINTFSVDEYIKRICGGSLATSLTLNFTKRQRAVYYLFWSAYGLQINSDSFLRLIGTPLEKMYGLELFAAQRLGLVTLRDNVYCLTERAAYIYHYLEQRYTTAYIDKMWSISRNKAFPDRMVLR